MEASRLLGIFTMTGATVATVAAQLGKNHWWKTGEGAKRTIVVEHQPADSILKYLEDMREALGGALAQAYVLAKKEAEDVPEPLALQVLPGDGGVQEPM